MEDNTEILTTPEHATAQAEALINGDIEFIDEQIHLTEVGVIKAFKLIRKRPVLERYLFTLLIRAIQETLEQLKNS